MWRLRLEVATSGGKGGASSVGTSSLRLLDALLLFHAFRGLDFLFFHVFDYCFSRYALSDGT